MRGLAALLLCAAAPFAAATQEKVLQTLEHDGVARFVISRGGIFDVTVKGYSGPTVRVEVLSADPGDAVSESRSGEELTIAPVRRERVRSIGSRAPRISVRLPESTDLAIETSTGNIVVETVNGSKRLQSSTGSMTVRSCRGAVEARSSTGNQRYDYVTGDLRAQSSTGALELSNFEGRADLESSTGRLWGRGVKVTGDSSFRSSTGRIEMDFANPLEDFTFSLQSFTGAIEVGATEARGKVETGTGPLKVTGQTSTGRQSYR